MKILLDENLSHRIVEKVKDSFPELTHVRLVGLEAGTDDIEIWRWAKENDFAIIATKDVDFQGLLRLYGPPPKIIHIRIFNQPNAIYAQLLTDNYGVIKQFYDSDEEFLLELRQFNKEEL